MFGIRRASETVSTVFTAARETVETVSEVLPARDTPLKQGVNESAWFRLWWLMKISGLAGLSLRQRVNLLPPRKNPFNLQLFTPQRSAALLSQS